MTSCFVRQEQKKSVGPGIEPGTIGCKFVCWPSRPFILAMIFMGIKFLCLTIWKICSVSMVTTKVLHWFHYWHKNDCNFHMFFFAVKSSKISLAHIETTSEILHQTQNMAVFITSTFDLVDRVLCVMNTLNFYPDCVLCVINTLSIYPIVWLR